MALLTDLDAQPSVRTMSERPSPIVARCHPALEGLLPVPVPARAALPDWLRAMPSDVESPLIGEAVRTLKHCSPMIDALALGFILPLPARVEARGGALHWDWDFPVIEDAPLSRAPLGVHVPEQASGSPLAPAEGGFIVKFLNYWSLSAPPGWQILFTHPFGHPDLPFRTLTGLVDADGFRDGYVHFPALWPNPGWEGVLEAGTPVAQAIALPRMAPSIETRVMTSDEVTASRTVQEALQSERGVYRRSYRIGPASA
ncbi:MAG: hypothetical protein AAFQ75_10060 [Pseudomonadota bacterium]